MLIDNHAIAQGELLRAQLDLAAKVAVCKAKGTPLRKRGTPQAKKNAVLREVWA